MQRMSGLSSKDGSLVKRTFAPPPLKAYPLIPMAREAGRDEGERRIRMPWDGMAGHSNSVLRAGKRAARISGISGIMIAKNTRDNFEPRAKH